MKEKAPAFQFYPKDLLSDGIAMSFSWSLLGRYLKLLCFDWMDDGILDSDSTITRLAGLDDGAAPEGPEEAIRLLRMKFIKHPSKEGREDDSFVPAEFADDLPAFFLLKFWQWNVHGQEWIGWWDNFD